MAPKKLSQKVVEQLVAAFRRNGYVRQQNADRVAADGFQKYKKGFEIRLVANSWDELLVLRDLLEQADFDPGTPFAKSNQWRQPIYGREAVDRFLEMVESVPEVQATDGASH